MLPSLYRLTRMKDFEILFKQGRFVGTELLTLKIWRIEPNQYPRRKYHRDDLKIGFVVSTKIEKRAVGRNRLKRQMREVVRLLLKEKKIKAGYMMAFLTKKEMIGKTYQEIEKEIIFVLRKAKVLL